MFSIKKQTFFFHVLTLKKKLKILVFLANVKKLFLLHLFLDLINLLSSPLKTWLK